MSLLSKKTLAKKLLQSKKFRESYVFEHIKRHIPFQVRTMRTEREWSQAKAGEALGKPQNVISRLESPAYGKLTLQTLLDVARGFDVGLVIKFVPFSRLVREYEDVSFEALSAKSVSDPDEARKIEEWAAGKPATTDVANTIPGGVPAQIFGGWVPSGYMLGGQTLQAHTLPFAVLGSRLPLHTDPPLPNVVSLTPEQNCFVFTEPETQVFFRKVPGTPIPPLPDVQELSTYTM